MKNLSKFNGKRVRITDINGDGYEGICIYNSEEYNEHEFGEKEDGLQFPSMLFYSGDIKSVEVIDEYGGAFGRLEETAVDDGIDMIEEIMYSEEPEHIIRLLRCIEKRLEREKTLPDKEQIAEFLKCFLKYNNIAEAAEIINRILVLL